MSDQSYFATAARGLETLLVTELVSFGAVEVEEAIGGVHFQGPLQVALRACLWSRLASRILAPIAEFAADTTDQLYDGVRQIDWRQHLDITSSLAVDAHVSQSKIDHSRYALLRVKDAVVDQLRDSNGQRPNIDPLDPDLRLNLYLFRNRATISIDLSGAALHKRGYRSDGLSAPLKENLAAAILLSCDWPAIHAAGGAFLDPMCGSGTLPLEAAMIATDSAPGLHREHFGFLGWRQFDGQHWDELLEEAEARKIAGLERQHPPLIGYDENTRAIRQAWEHARAAGVDRWVHFERRELGQVEPPATESGLLVTNPPYGERLGEASDLPPLYNRLGEKMCAFGGWQAGVITSEVELGRAIGLRAHQRTPLYNGALKCQLLHFTLDETNHWKSLADGAGRPVARRLTAEAEMLANRLRKNRKKLSKWLKAERLECYRLYDADLPEFNMAIDIYGDEVHLQEYQAPKDVPEQKAERRVRDAVSAVMQVLEVPNGAVHTKQRQRQKGVSQYQRQDRRGVLKQVNEGDLRFLVNLSDYIDTGLFLDHRPTRQLLRSLAAGTRFLNLFAYTGTASVYAAAGGAAETTTVDMSRTYTDWAQKNMQLNGFDGPQHQFVQADCLSWLEQPQKSYDLIFLDPPSFSNSKGMDGTFDIQRDHVRILQSVIKFLASGGILIFSNNLRSFKLDSDQLPGLKIEELSNQTLPPDFARNPRIHNCWRIERA
ncbi:bifunctional 23S rRNA (guanine(2069)-N(7))-methyltransferase RlmK/23S rRNA (guanine(2445)-N(2))-methyltransferase RlmL [Geopsychrobacter electrodiphilus]|uniref:bifunctional 23S rRNA (guanine(2069)-N(7))-methyltransferase RlmK/23S rRNA (guanine(2445)-N(2))-methyltransferase RlmL n=1 Tax=Geopsychrobacter electrodiphilus TaxID=225196 RepID=UPI00037C5E55|nr:bifunctional 23S rRNA (guanine(2069)-N(7))-methyltransferase RlmK/23S rRNA (guanine(2445)-N(2))-methyltransferase RlmL [Geopsychrobacter electrodiphilus]